MAATHDPRTPRRARPASGPASGPVSRAVRQLLLASSEAQQALARRLGLGVTDLAALEHLFAAPGGLGPAELGRLLGIRSASATALADRLEQAGHVAREAHASDRRRLVLRPTAHARTELLDALQPLVDAIEHAAGGLGDAEQATIISFLTKAADRLRDTAADTDGAPGTPA